MPGLGRVQAAYKALITRSMIEVLARVKLLQITKKRMKGEVSLAGVLTLVTITVTLQKQRYIIYDSTSIISLIMK